MDYAITKDTMDVANMRNIYYNKELHEEMKEVCRQENLAVRFSSHLMYILQLVRTLNVRSGLENYKESSTPINYDTLATIVSKYKLREMLNILIGRGYISTNGRYIVGMHSMKYSLRVDLYDIEWKRLDPTSDLTCPYLRRSLYRRQAVVEERIKNAPKGYIEAIKGSKKVSVNYKKAMEIIDELDASDDKKKSWRQSVELLDKKKFHVTISEKTNRLFTNLSSFPRVLRSSITINRRRLMTVDIPNCQPLLLGLILKGRENVCQDEVNRYLEICLDAGFYEHMSSKAGDVLDLNDQDVRANFKRRIFAGVLFDRNRRNLSKYEDVFDREFPTIYRAVRGMKMYEHNRVAIMLQQEESSIIYDAVERAAGFGDSAITAIHDCIIGDYKNIEYIKWHLSEVFYDRYGLCPKLKIEKL